MLRWRPELFGRVSRTQPDFEQQGRLHLDEMGARNGVIKTPSSRDEIAPPLPGPKHSLKTPLRLRCPPCSQVMNAIDPAETSARPVCPSCGFVFLNLQGIWRALAPDREDRFRQFVREYQSVRAQERRGSSRPGFYLALPYQDLTGRNSWQWKIRGRSFCYLENKVLPQIEREHPQGLDVLDLGAGNCWMSYRLALRRHRPVAVDLLLNEEDGLGAAEHYFLHLPKPFPRFQAEMDRLPFGARQFDVAIFNASFHYSEDYQRTVKESLRCLRRPGHLLIVDTPFYNHDESGRQMVEERHTEFERKFGFRSDSIPSREYLTGETLQELARDCPLTWNILKPWYGLGWTLRPLKACLLARRESSKFFILWATVGDS